MSTPAPSKQLEADRPKKQAPRTAPPETVAGSCPKRAVSLTMTRGFVHPGQAAPVSATTQTPYTVPDVSSVAP